MFSALELSTFYILPWQAIDIMMGEDYGSMAVLAPRGASVLGRSMASKIQNCRNTKTWKTKKYFTTHTYEEFWRHVEQVF